MVAKTRVRARWAALVMAMVVTAGVNAPGPAEARCQGDQVRRFNYETKKSDCVAMEDAEETKRDRLLRQQRQPRHEAEVMQRSRKLEQQRVQQQRALERSRIKSVQDQRIRAQQQLNA